MSSELTRRSWLQSVPSALAPLAAQAQSGSRTGRPNIVILISDQFRWDCIGEIGINPMNLTPNLDAMARRGTLFRSAFVAQPVCTPARASIFTGQYPSRHGVWHNDSANCPMDPHANTIATTLRHSGYSANFIGKWHLSPNVGDPKRPQENGPVSPEHRGGFLDLWQASNILEFTSHAYQGDLFDNNGSPIHFSGIYRADFMTGLAQRFLRSATSPFLLVVSYLEVHHQNDTDTYDAPKEYKNRYPDPFVPHDLRPYPGSWGSQLADYYRCVARMDDSVGAIRKTLAETGLDKNTIVLFMSDHGCHFKTRNIEYRRSPHEGSIHIPLVIEGPGFNRSMQISELVSQVDLMPTLLEAAGVPVPDTVQGHSFLPLLDRRTEGWRNEVYFEMTEYMTGRALRTPQYTYAVAAPKGPGWKMAPSADRYVEYILYDLFADPYQSVNLDGRAPYERVAAGLRERLLARIAEASGARPTIDPSWFPYS